MESKVTALLGPSSICVIFHAHDDAANWSKKQVYEIFICFVQLLILLKSPASCHGSYVSLNSVTKVLSVFISDCGVDLLLSIF